MSADALDTNRVMEERHTAVVETIHPITLEELKALGEDLFPFLDHPWRQTYFSFLEQNSPARFYHATTHDRVQIIYCNDPQRGIWFMPGGGVGPLQETTLKTMKEVVEKQ
jgi:hypothetical protein